MASKEELYKIANQILDYSIERTGVHPNAQIIEDEMRWLLRTNSFRQILKDLEILEILKKYLKIELDDTYSHNDKYPVDIKCYNDTEEFDRDNTIIWVSKEERELLKEYLENDRYTR